MYIYDNMVKFQMERVLAIIERWNLNDWQKILY